LNRSRTLVETWVRSQENLDEIWEGLIARIDTEDGWQKHGKAPKLDSLSEDASLQTDVVLLNGILDKFVDAKPLPDIWPSVMLTTASTKEFSLSPKRQLDICKRGWQQDRDAPLASHACAWTLFRNDEWQRCADILQTDPKLKSDENGFILAMALWHLGQKELAHSTLDKTSAWMEANRELLETRRKAKPLVEQPNSETMYRLKQEAEQLIKPNDTP
jgi:hypothetical protein